MSQLCATPSVKKYNDEVLLDVRQAADQSCSSKAADAHSSSPRQGPPAWLIYAWLGLLTLMATAALVMSAWNTSQHKNNDNNYNADQGVEPVALVTKPQQAAAQGWKLEGNIYQGTGYWGSKFDMAVPRADHGVASYNGLIYVFGGMNYNPVTNASEVLTSMNAYNMYESSVLPMLPMPEPRTRFGYAVAQDKLYVFGGFTSTDDTAVPSASTMVFDFKAGTWQDMDSSMDMKFARVDFAGAAVAGKVYAVGGYLDGFKVTALAEVLDPATGKWSAIPSMHIPRADGSAHGVDGVLYVLGGSVSNDDADGWTSAVEAYDPSTGQWSFKANMTYPSGQYAAETLGNGNIVVAGGEGNYTVGQSTIPWVQLYITSLDVWVVKAAMIEPRYRFDMATAHGNFVYAFGGALNCDRPTSRADQDSSKDDCSGQVYATILGFYDNQYPNLWAATTAVDDK